MWNLAKSNAMKMPYCLVPKYFSEWILVPPSCENCTGMQLPPLSSVPYRIIVKRRYILAAQLLLREKSGT